MEMLLLKKKEFVSMYQGCLETPFGECYIVASMTNTNDLIDISGTILHPNGKLEDISDEATIKLVTRALHEYLDQTTEPEILCSIG